MSLRALPSQPGDQSDELPLKMRVSLEVNAFEVVAGGPVGDAEAFGRGFERIIAQEAAGQPRLRRSKAADSHQVGGQGSRPRVEIGEDDETLNERKALTDRVREPGGIGDDRAAALSREDNRRPKRLGAAPPDQVMQGAVENRGRVAAPGDDAAANDLEIGSKQTLGGAIET